MGPHDKDWKPLTPYEVWQLNVKKKELCDWFHETWQATARYSGTSRPIDGLIMYASGIYVRRPATADTKGR